MLGGVNQALYLAITNAIQRQDRKIADSLERLSTGERIVRPGDEPATFGIVSRLNTQLRGLTEASKNVNLVQGYTSTAEEALFSMEGIALQLRDLALQAADTGLSTEERELLQSEASDLLQELQSISVDTEFNGRSLLNGSFGTQSVQIGYRAGDTLSFSIGDARSSSLGKLAIYSGSQNSLAAIGSSAATALTLNGVSIGASTSDGVSISGDSGSALALATAINLKANETNVNAEALATEVTLYIDSFGGSYTGTFGTGDFYLNDTAITGSIASAGDLVAAINNQTSETGVVAELDGTGNVVMTASDGRNIALTLSNSTGNDVYHIFNISANNASGIFAVTASTSLSVGSDDFVTGAIQLYSSKQILISGGASVSASIGIATGAKALVSGTSATNVTLSSASNATQAIKILDAVIDDISTLRAEIGAVHSRLDYRAAMLIDQQFGLEDAKTRIGGTDFALEVAKLTAAQILQNSGLAALAQANVQRSTVQSLLGLLG